MSGAGGEAVPAMAHIGHGLARAGAQQQESKQQVSQGPFLVAASERAEHKVISCASDWIQLCDGSHGEACVRGQSPQPVACLGLAAGWRAPQSKCRACASSGLPMT